MERERINGRTEGMVGGHEADACMDGRIDEGMAGGYTRLRLINGFAEISNDVLGIQMLT